MRVRLVRRKTKVLSASDSGEQSRGERTNQYEFGNAIDGQPCAEILEPGIAPSRLKAYVIRELDVIEKVFPQRATTKRECGPQP
jgi:hypothetical protein